MLYGAIRRREPGFHVALKRRDLAVVVPIDISLLAAFIGYTGWKLGW